MRILAINSGSASLKFAIHELSPSAAGGTPVHGKLDWSSRDGSAAKLQATDRDGAKYEQSESIADHRSAMRFVIDWLRSRTDLHELHGVGHRIVHGGPKFNQAVRINPAVLRELELVSELAPLHNPGAIEIIRAAQSALPGSIPNVAVFDTAFHRQMPPKAELYPLDLALSERLQLKRYGFHGIAHQYLAERCAELMRRPLTELRLITLQLGNGCSATAIEGGRSVDTSMGFTPLEGLMMGTRCGDIDAGLIAYLLRHEVNNVTAVEQILNEQCGLLGVSGRSRDMRELIKAEGAGDSRSALAVDMFCYRVIKYVGAYLAVLHGADAIVFGGGIGENAAEVRRRICDNLNWAGISIDPQRNVAAAGIEMAISTEASRVKVYVIPVREELLIARETAGCLGS